MLFLEVCRASPWGTPRPLETASDRAPREVKVSSQAGPEMGAGRGAGLNCGAPSKTVVRAPVPLFMAGCPGDQPPSLGIILHQPFI